MSHFIRRNLGFSLFASVILVNSMIAGTPGQCDQKCDPSCGTRSGVCVVKISRDSSGATATIVNLDDGSVGQPNADVCVRSGTEIVWLTSEDKSSFKVTFGKQHPFVHQQGAAAKFKGKNGQPASDTAKGPSGSSCYQYSLVHCINSNGMDCKKADPKVIVTNVRGD